MTTGATFKQCSTCGFEWETRERLLEDPDLRIIGYQVNFRKLDEGLFLFNHNCGTSLGFMAGNFKDLYKGPVFSERATGTSECPEFCLHKSELRPCPAKCECAYVREIIQVIKNWPKKKRDESQ